MRKGNLRKAGVQNEEKAKKQLSPKRLVKFKAYLERVKAKAKAKKAAASGTEAPGATGETSAASPTRRRGVTLVPHAEVHEIDREAAVAARSPSPTRSVRTPPGGGAGGKGKTGKDKGKGKSKGGKTKKGTV